MDRYYEYISLDLPAILTALFASIACALLGSFLVLRRQSLMGDAISHAVLPGIVGAFLVSSSRNGFVVFLGAAAAAVLAVLLVEFIHKLGKVEIGAAMGVVFSSFFAGGVLLIERAAARSVDLDADCLLHGQLESIFWFPPRNAGEFFTLATFSALPPEVMTSFTVMLAVTILIIVLYKELQLATFDPAHATALGFRAPLLHYLLMIFVAAAVVASFEAVGSILVIGMLICPAAAARMLTDRLRSQLIVSGVLASFIAAGGYASATIVPWLAGWPHSVNAAGAMISLAGLTLGAVILIAPRHGIISRRLRQVFLALRIAEEDILGYLYRKQEHGEQRVGIAEIGCAVGGSAYCCRLAISLLSAGGKILLRSGTAALTDRGRNAAAAIIRNHRLWEEYLVEDAGLQLREVHTIADQLEHLPATGLEE
ncbi:MAG TPA: metal ABC transporter permease, partial [Oligoflexia bacterium]|nr:metal ABC transporter permease [Oligoflexia bacterium]